MLSNNNRRGFTLIETIIIIIILSVISTVILPRFIDFRSKSYEAIEKETIGAIHSGIAIYSVEKVIEGLNNTYPYSLDNANYGNAGASNPLFTQVLLQPVIEPNWEKISGNRYLFRPTGHYYLYQSTGNFTRQ
ncbi:MAG: prepilin-type N-terminal cleavage/methylation domain-containing protein [Candidatus Margulisbacteria bacterium]|nr:prepilin-type N-terminal cleavage/methylation domain-containing protein [Candidatus Margulisiibacteriota bacterium]MBU1617575.1 prepilin-type N-terminal cleavage/methylation domain-containing protein [Candidatus Margulisiibacteriota bacterium]MBU1867376.1 prepilin-type N-terminal cleavage/methylation domain-containing protein [Candidatus Margulisiibacteriota bacterium]